MFHFTDLNALNHPDGCEFGERQRDESSAMETEMIDVEAQINKHPAVFRNLANRPILLKFVDVVYKIKEGDRGMLKMKRVAQEDRSILNGVSGMVCPGEMLGMLGPSGSGKTTLLTALGGRNGSGGTLEGTITYNGKPFSNSLKRKTGFVTQDDVLYPHLTVTETLVFTALLRLPNNITKEKKVLQAEGVIAQLGLTKCKDSVVGGNILRGISGGERKRVSIGQEMLVNPSLIFLDEPTSGLDSTTAQRIVSTLLELANGGRTIVMTIHQPSSRLYYMFHKVLLLSDGNPLYFGKGSDALNYFSGIGFSPKVAMNPADFLLDLANGIASDDSSDSQVILVKQELVSAFKSNLGYNLAIDLQEPNNVVQDSSSKDQQHQDWPTSWWQQFSVLIRRGVKERYHESFSGLRVTEVLVIAFLTGILWWKTDPSHLQDQIGLLFFYVGFWGFYPLFHAIFAFPQERKMLEKERSSGMYKLSSYFMALTVGDLPMELILPTLFLVITYWMAGLRHSVWSFFGTLLVLLYGVLVFQGLGFAIGAVVMDTKSATTLGSVIMLAFLLAGGFYAQHVPKFISWIKYISVVQYTYKLMLIAQYKGSDTYSCGENICLVGDFPSIRTVGLDGCGIAVFALTVMLVFYRVVAYVALMRIGLTRKK